MSELSLKEAHHLGYVDDEEYNIIKKMEGENEKDKHE